MSKIFLLTRPTHEPIVSYLSAWSKDILKLADKKNIRYSDFSGRDVKKKEVEKFIKKMGPELLIFNGHGSPGKILGHNDEPLIETGENSNLLKNKITYARACSTSSILGKEAVESGGKCFIGYSKPFGFVHRKSRECTPQTDKISRPFKKISNIIPISLLKGHSAKKAVKNLRKNAKN